MSIFCLIFFFAYFLKLIYFVIVPMIVIDALCNTGNAERMPNEKTNYKYTYIFKMNILNNYSILYNFCCCACCVIYILNWLLPACVIYRIRYNLLLIPSITTNSLWHVWIRMSNFENVNSYVKYESFSHLLATSCVLLIVEKICECIVSFYYQLHCA